MKHFVSSRSDGRRSGSSGSVSGSGGGTKQECCLRLRLWSSRKYGSDIRVASIFWPEGGCMVDANGKQVPIENWARTFVVVI